MLRQAVFFAGWITLILLPAAGAASGFSSLIMSLRVLDASNDWAFVTSTILYDMMPALLMIGAGVALGSGCLILVSIDQCLSKLEVRT